jgi:hypothetical protein
MAVDLAALLLADRDVLEAGQVAVAPVVELPEPKLEDQLPPGVVRVAGAVFALQVRARGGQRRSIGDRLEQGEDLARLLRPVVLGLALIEAIVVEQRLAQIVGAPLVRRDVDLGEQAVPGLAPAVLVDPDEAARRIARLIHGDRGNAAPGLVGVPDALIDRGLGRGQTRRPRNHQRRGRAQVPEKRAPCERWRAAARPCPGQIRPATAPTLSHLQRPLWHEDSAAFLRRTIDTIRRARGKWRDRAARSRGSSHRPGLRHDRAMSGTEHAPAGRARLDRHGGDA